MQDVLVIPVPRSVVGPLDRHFRQRAQFGDRRAEFVGGIGGEPPLPREGARQPGQQVVEAEADRLQLGGDPHRGEGLVQRPGADGVGLPGKLV